MMSRHYVLAAGGTGGHMVPAHALAEELLRRGHRVALITDDRGARIPGLFDDVQVHVLPAGRLARRPGRLAAGRRAAIMTGRAMALRLYETFLPSAVIGFGGYPALPGLARRAARPHPDPAPRAECGARPGQPADRRPGRRDRDRLSETSSGCRPRPADKAHLVGNPVRDEVLALRDQPFPPLTEDGIFRVLVTGGSQGASILSEVVPEGLGAAARAFPPPAPGHPAMPRRGYRRRCARAMPRSASPPTSPPICRTCPSGSPGRISSSPAPAPRPSPS